MKQGLKRLFKSDLEEVTFASISMKAEVQPLTVTFIYLRK